MGILLPTCLLNSIESSNVSDLRVSALAFSKEPVETYTKLYKELVIGSRLIRIRTNNSSYICGAMEHFMHISLAWQTRDRAQTGRYGA